MGLPFPVYGFFGLFQVSQMSLDSAVTRWHPMNTENSVAM